MGAHAGRRGRGLGPGGPGRIARASGLSRRLGARQLPRGRAGERCPFHRRLRACAGAHRWLCAGEARRVAGNTAARHAVPTIRRVPRLFRAMAVHSPTMLPTPFWQVLTNGKVPSDKVGPHIDLLAEFPIWGRRTTDMCRAMQLRLSQPRFARRPGAWALYEGGRYEPN